MALVGMQQMFSAAWVARVSNLAHHITDDPIPSVPDSHPRTANSSIKSRDVCKRRLLFPVGGEVAEGAVQP